MSEPASTNESKKIDGFPAVRCESCDTLYGHAPIVCRECLDDSLDQTTIPGAGQVYAQTTIRVPGSDHRGQEPFDIAIVDVGDDETVRVTARIEGTDTVGPGDPVAFLERRDGVFYFQPQ